MNLKLLRLLRPVLIAISFCLMAVQAMAQDEAAIKNAIAATEAYLALVDSGKYDEAWESSAEPLRKAISKDAWRNAAGSFRAEMGANTARKIMSGADAPKAGHNARGDHIEVQYTSSFAKRPHAIERVAAMLEADGKYRVVGYRIRPASSSEELAAAAKPPKASLSDEEIRTILRERIDLAKQGVGIVVGLIDDKGERVIAYGWTRSDGGKPVDGNTIFEIGSITKTFTATLLADMALRGEVKLDDPISKLLPKTVKSPTRTGKEITLLNLTQHTSSLPRLPNNMSRKDPANPYADYTVEQLYAFLNEFTHTREIGAYPEYSNLGVGLLGHLLALRAGSDYETLVRTRVLAPLGMNSTGITITPAMREHKATGHNQRAAVSDWDLPTFAGAGALRSSANDMLKYLSAQMGLKASLEPNLSAAIARTHRGGNDKAIPGDGMGLGWFQNSLYNNKVFTHNGGTGGFRSEMAFDSNRRVGVVVLTNSNADVSDIARHLLDNRNALGKPAPAKTFKAIKIDPKSFDAFIGTYQIAPNNTLTFSREGERFFCVASGGMGKIEVFPYEPTSFYSDSFDAQVTFLKVGETVKSLMFHQDGRSTPVQRID